MIKQFLGLALLLLLVSCKDDPELVSGQVARIDSQINGNLSPEYTYTYNNQGQIEELIRHGSSRGDGLLTYTYIDGKLTEVFGGFPTPCDVCQTWTLTYTGDLIARIELQSSSFFTGTTTRISNITYDGNGRPTSAVDSLLSPTEPTQVSNSSFEYDGIGNLTRFLQTELDGTVINEIVFLYDDQKNPFAGKFHSFFTGSFDFFNSPNNPIRRTWTQLGQTSVEVFEYTYNNGFPTSYQVTRDGFLQPQVVFLVYQ